MGRFDQFSRKSSARACMHIYTHAGYQCPPGGLLSSAGIAGPPYNENRTHGYTMSPQQYEGLFSVDDGARVPIKGSECTGGGTCEGTSVCTAPNTGEFCDNHIMCTGVFYPSLRQPGDPLAHRGPAICRRLRTAAVVQLSLSQDGMAPLQFTADGMVFGFTNPEPPEFRTRTISESTAVAAATAVLSVTLSANFVLQPLGVTSVTLSGISSDTPSNARLPLFSSQVCHAVCPCRVPASSAVYLG